MRVLHLSKKRSAQDARQDLPVRVTLTASQIAKHHLRRAEEKRVNFVEIVVVALEDLGKRSPVILRCRRRHAWADLFQLLIFGVYPKNGGAAIKNRIVGAADGRDLILGYRRQRRGAESRYHLAKIELQ